MRIYKIHGSAIWNLNQMVLAIYYAQWCEVICRTTDLGKKQHIDILINGRRINHSNEHVIMDKSISFMIQLTGERRWDKCWCVFNTQLKSTVLKKHVKYDEMEHSELKLYISITVQYFFYHPKIHVNYCNLLISI